MISIKSKREINIMANSGFELAKIHRNLKSIIKPGITSWDIELFVQDYIRSHGWIAAQLGYEGYKYATCCSINSEVCHGFPRKKVLKQGDLIKVDICLNVNGGLSDSCWAYTVGKPKKEVKEIMDICKKSLYLGIEQAREGNRIGQIGFEIQKYVEENGYSVVRDFVGHGIGPGIHEDPMIPHYGEVNEGSFLKEGMVITIEPMINTGTHKIKMDPNGWTAYTEDGGLSCQYEHTIVITKEKPIILTAQD